jgi:hypothetical protein
VHALANGGDVPPLSVLDGGLQEPVRKRGARRSFCRSPAVCGHQHGKMYLRMSPACYEPTLRCDNARPGQTEEGRLVFEQHCGLAAFIACSGRLAGIIKRSLNGTKSICRPAALQDCSSSQKGEVAGIHSRISTGDLVNRAISSEKLRPAQAISADEVPVLS